MEKSIHSREYIAFLSLLKTIRQEAGMSQIQLAIHLEETQTFVSKCERGERRIDFIELRTWCCALGVSVSVFLERLEEVLAADDANEE
jgi:transcriptional regulator with XRE-family HTH domain